ncbi:hypothetical protein C1H76_6693 [Elsinoe australis]|uniref:Uncharacterized protein n=1 Tax=Elsinoe australis TaxID=40998 RepID=A0A4V6DTM3_9PEZI|nr:hypothetical protein C1H76_6693 [Elsinoe australis]
MACGRPEQRTKYLGLALDYRDKALEKLPYVFQNPSDDQGEACFWATAMIGLITLARSQVDRSATAISAMLELSRLWGGSKLPKARPSIGSQTPGSSTEPEFAEGLRNFINYLSGSSDKPVYVKVLELLQKEHHMWRQNNSTGILSWAACVDKRFMQLVEQKDVIANLVVAFYGAALHELRNTWYIGSFGSELVREILPLRDAPDSTLITIQDFVITILRPKQNNDETVDDYKKRLKEWMKEPEDGITAHQLFQNLRKAHEPRIVVLYHEALSKFLNTKFRTTAEAYCAEFNVNLQRLQAAATTVDKANGIDIKQQPTKSARLTDAECFSQHLELRPPRDKRKENDKSKGNKRRDKGKANAAVTNNANNSDQSGDDMSEGSFGEIGAAAIAATAKTTHPSSSGTAELTSTSILFDNCASTYIVRDRKAFTKLYKFDKPVKFDQAANTTIFTYGGTALLRLGALKIKLHNAMYSPTSSYTLISSGRLHEARITQQGELLYKTKNGKLTPIARVLYVNYITAAPLQQDPLDLEGEAITEAEQPSLAVLPVEPPTSPTLADPPTSPIPADPPTDVKRHKPPSTQNVEATANSSNFDLTELEQASLEPQLDIREGQDPPPSPAPAALPEQQGSEEDEEQWDTPMLPFEPIQHAGQKHRHSSPPPPPA